MSIATELKVERLLKRADDLEMELSEVRQRVKVLEDESTALKTKAEKANGRR